MSFSFTVSYSFSINVDLQDKIVILLFMMDMGTDKRKWGLMEDHKERSAACTKCLEEFAEKHKWKPQADMVKGNDILPRCTPTMCLDTIYKVYTFDNSDKSRAMVRENGTW